MKQKRNKYNPYIKIVERETERTRMRLYKQLKPLIKGLALAVGNDITSTQYGCYPNDHNYKDDNPKIEKFIDFIHTLSDEYKIDYYFEVKDGKFTFFN